MQKTPFIIITLLLIALSRLVPHPFNFTPVAAMALFGGAHLRSFSFSLAVVMIGMLFSDILVNLVLYHNVDAYGHFSGFYFLPVYISMAGIVWLGSRMRTITAGKVVGFSLLSSLGFWIVTNFACWPGNPLYSQDISGLMQSYIAALPFLKSFAGDLFYNTVLFGGYHLLRKQVPALA